MVRWSLLCVGMTLLAAAVLQTRSEPASAGGPPPPQSTLVISWPGDTNCDDAIDASDALVALQYLVRLIPFDNCLRGSDVTCNGTRDARDVLTLLRFTVSLSITRPEGCPPIGPEQQYRIGASVTQHEVDITQSAVAVATAFFEANFDVSTDIFTIWLDSDLETLASHYSQYANISLSTAHDELETDGVATGQTATFIYTGDARWASAPDDFAREGIVVHELFRIFQHELVGSPGLYRESNSQTPYGGPQWLIEGSSAWAQNVVIYGHKSLLPCPQEHSTAALETMETKTGMATHDNSVALASMAVDYIIDQTSLKALIDVWFDIGEGESWQSAFHDALGVTIADFYTNFAAHRNVVCP